MREDAGAVDALPVEAVMGEGVGVVPGDLLGQEPVEAGAPSELRQSTGVPEAVWQPDSVGLDAEAFPEVGHAEQELADQGLTGGHHRIRFDPHSADREEAAFSDPLLDLREELRLVL